MKNGLSAFILLCLVVTSCSDDKLKVDVSNVDVSIMFERFDQDMVKATSAEDMKAINQDFISRGGELYEFYVYDMLRSGSVYDDSIANYLWYFVTDSVMKVVHKDISTTFTNFDWIKEELVDGFKHIKYHLPEAPQPNKIITYNGAFTYGVVSTDTVVGIGLEMYLGPENKVVKEIRYPVYVKDKMHADYLMVDVMQSWLMTNVIKDDRGETFLSNMIYYGKLRYAIEAMLPNADKNLIMRYTRKELDFALASEYNVWQYLVDMNWIYSIDMKVKLRFFEEAPTTVGIEESPGRLGQFMGWQMVRSYMDANPEITINELLTDENDTKILKAYKPKENE